MALALNNLKRVDKQRNQTKPNQVSYDKDPKEIKYTR